MTKYIKIADLPGEGDDHAGDGGGEGGQEPPAHQQQDEARVKGAQRGLRGWTALHSFEVGHPW